MKAYVRACPHCQLYKPTVQPKTEIKPSEPVSRPFVEISLDGVSGLPMTKTGFNSVLNIIHRFSKWAIVIPWDKTMTTNQLIELFWKHVRRLPGRLPADTDYLDIPREYQVLRLVTPLHCRLRGLTQGS